jgi:hypothetical protein
MKDKLFLLVILLLSLAIGLMMPIIEGACSNSSYVSGGSGSTGAPVKYGNEADRKAACGVASDSENSARFGDVSGLIAKLGPKISKAFGDSNILLARSKKFQKGSKSLQNLANDKDVDTGDACKQYPEAC